MVGERIKARRERAGFASQTDLAREMGISASRVSDWETGKREPKGDLRRTLLRLVKASEADIFGIDPPDQNSNTLLGEAVAILAALDKDELANAFFALKSFDKRAAGKASIKKPKSS